MIAYEGNSVITQDQYSNSKVRRINSQSFRLVGDVDTLQVDPRKDRVWEQVSIPWRGDGPRLHLVCLLSTDAKPTFSHSHKEEGSVSSQSCESPGSHGELT